MMSSFSSPVIVLSMICCRHSSTPTGLMPLSFFFSGISLHIRRVNMWSCGMVSIARRLARVEISLVSFCEWVPYDFEQIISLQASMSIPSVLVLQTLMSFSIGCNFILRYIFKDDPLCFGFRLISYGRFF